MRFICCVWGLVRRWPRPAARAWERFAAAPDSIASTMRREWVIAPVPAQTGQNESMRISIGIMGSSALRKESMF